jgi:CO/xanthine dehydrogenase Mo-binding subunit
VGISRRGFVKTVTASGIALSVSRLTGAQEPEFAARETLPGRQSWNPAATGIGRIDGVAKVTGAKLYAADFRAADLPNWPPATSHAMCVRASDATHVYAGIDLSRLSSALKPSVVITAADLARTGMRVPEFYVGDLLCPVGKTPLYLGQPVAMLIFEDFDALDQARLALRDAPVVKFGKDTGPVKMPNYGAFRLTRVGGPTPEAPDVYSLFRNGLVSPGRFEDNGRPIWPRLPIPTGQAYAEAATHGEEIRAELAANDPTHLVLDREFQTQSLDPMFLEPESGLGWHDAKRKTLELVVGVQSPYDAATSVAYMLGNAKGAFKPTRINTNVAYCGGGFGGRDHTAFPMYVALAAMFFPNRPVRLANNRYEQFQSGIKGHVFKIRTRMGVDRASGKIIGLAADHELDGGGLANFSVNVAAVSAKAAIGIYYIPKVDLTTYAYHSRGVPAGSLRSYGTLQTMTALEVMVDEICATLPLDPIEFRRRNALATGGRTLAGNTYSVSVRTPEILDKLEKHPIWRQRAEEKARGQQGNILVGTGVACASKNYGTGGDCTLGSVEIAPDGLITIHSDAAEMGNGIGTAVATRVAAHLGRVADEIAVADVNKYGALELVTSGDSYSMNQPTQDAAARDPRWVPAISSATAASNGAHVGTHAAAEAARVVFRYGLWPAALELWGVAPNDPKANDWKAARWRQGQLIMPGRTPLAFSVIAAKAHALNLVTGAMAHGFNRWAWAQATFPMIAGQAWTADIDALAVRRGAGKFVRVDRSNVQFPSTELNRVGATYTSLCGTLVRVEIDRETGALRIPKAYSVLECGQALVLELVLGQAQGGFAMGVGRTLLETLPLYEDGPGNGKWNLGQYLIARGSDLPLHGLEVEVLPPVVPDEPPKGIAEVVMIPVVPALLNAINDAIGHRFQSTPVTQAMIKGALK